MTGRAGRRPRASRRSLDDRSAPTRMSCSKWLPSLPSACSTARACSVAGRPRVPGTCRSSRARPGTAATPADVLAMRHAVEWAVDVDESRSSTSPLPHARAAAGRIPADTAAWLRTIARARTTTPAAGPFRYCSLATDVLGWAAARAGGAPFPECRAREVWSRIGAEQDAHIMLDRSDFAIVEGGICTTLRDLARVGLDVPRGGPRRSDGPVVPASMARQRAAAARPRRARGRLRGLGGASTDAAPGAFDHDCWWIDDAPRGVYAARGMNGQSLLVHHPARRWSAKFSTFPGRARLGPVRAPSAGMVALCEHLAASAARGALARVSRRRAGRAAHPGAGGGDGSSPPSQGPPPSPPSVARRANAISSAHVVHRRLLVASHESGLPDELAQLEAFADQPQHEGHDRGRSVSGRRPTGVQRTAPWTGERPGSADAGVPVHGQHPLGHPLGGVHRLRVGAAAAAPAPAALRVAHELAQDARQRARRRPARGAGAAPKAASVSSAASGSRWQTTGLPSAMASIEVSPYQPRRTWSMTTSARRVALARLGVGDALDQVEVDRRALAAAGPRSASSTAAVPLPARRDGACTMRIRSPRLGGAGVQPSRSMAGGTTAYGGQAPRRGAAAREEAADDGGVGVAQEADGLGRAVADVGAPEVVDDALAQPARDAGRRRARGSSDWPKW